MRQVLNALSLLIISLLLNSCRQVLYFPDRANTPGLTEALQVKATVSISPKGDGDSYGNHDDTITTKHKTGTGTSVDLAFSPIAHLGIIASYRWLDKKTVTNYQNPSGSGVTHGEINGKRWELGVGYYSNLSNKSFAEIYAGYSNGFLKQYDDGSTTTNFDTRYFRPFLQPAVGFKLGSIFSFSGGFRTTLVRFYNFTSPNPLLRNEIGNADQDIEKTTYVFLEPFWNVEGGYKFIKANVQIGASQQFGNAKITESFPWYISFGMVLEFSPSMLKNKHPSIRD